MRFNAQCISTGRFLGSVGKMNIIRRIIESRIPYGMYCYTLTSVKPDHSGINIKICPYYRDTNIAELVGKCKYIGREIDDQCKVCGINEYDGKCD